MKEQIMQRVDIVLNALNNVSVMGKSNLANMSGSIAMLEELKAILNDVDVITPTKDEE